MGNLYRLGESQMTQHRDRLGQPLAVGDWCVCDNCKTDPRINGHKFRISRIEDGRVAPIITDHTPDFMFQSYAAFGTNTIRKIDYKPQETTSWDAMSDVWVPEGVTL